jgi:DHA1 family multidrug resistance protein-like MFS transporter
VARWRMGRRGALVPWRRNLYVLMLSVFVSFSGFTFVSPFLPLFIQQLGVKDTGDAALWSGLIFGVSPLISGVLAPFWAGQAERYGPKRVVIFSLAMYFVVLSANAAIQSVPQLFALRLLIGVLGSVGVMSTALASTLAPPEQAGEAVGLMQATALASGIAAPVFGGVVVDAIGLRPAYVLAGLFSLVACAAMAVGYREEEARGRAQVKRQKRSMRDFARFPIFISLVFTVFLTRFIDGSFGPQLPLYIATLHAPIERLGFITGLIMTLGAIATSVAAAGSGRLSSRYAPRGLLLGSLLGGAIFCLPIAFVGHWGQLLVLRTLLGLLAGGALILAYAIAGRDLPADARLGAIAILAGLGQIGMAVSPFIAGLLAKWINLPSIFVLDSLLYLMLFGWVWLRLAPAPVSAVPEQAGGVTMRASKE